MKSISIDNGNSYYTGGQERAIWSEIMDLEDVITEAMDDDAREEAHRQFQGGDFVDFVNLYLALAPSDLVVG